MEEDNSDGFRYCIGCAVVKGKIDRGAGRYDFPLGEDELSDIHDNDIFADNVEDLINRSSWKPETQIILSGYLNEHGKTQSYQGESPIKIEIVEKEESNDSRNRL